MGEKMNIYDENDTYQGCYNPTTGMFTQSASLASDKVIINKDVAETLQLQGCKFIETVIVNGVHVEPVYITFDRFMEVANNEYNQKKECFELVYTVPAERQEPDERREMRENLQP